MIKFGVVVVLLIILYCLFSGLFFLFRDISHQKRIVKALMWRVGISVALFFILFLAFLTGLIEPHPLGQ